MECVFTGERVRAAMAAEPAPGKCFDRPLLLNMVLYSRADTIDGGSHRIQRNLIAERAPGLPRDNRGDT